MNALNKKRILVTGSAGFLGKHIVAALGRRHADVVTMSSLEYDLTKPSLAFSLLDTERPEMVIHAAAKVGGILANKKHPYTFGRDNLLMGINVIDACSRYHVKKLLIVGTTCSYPADCEPPFREDQLWSGRAEETNASYGHAKRLLLDLAASAVHQDKLICATSVILANLFGPGDNFDAETSHVIPALIRKLTEAVELNLPEVTCWGSGKATRDFLYVTDAAEGIVKALNTWDAPYPINLGTGAEIQIAALAYEIADIVGFQGKIIWSQNGLDGQRRRALDNGRAWDALQWTPQTELREGLEKTVEYFLKNRRKLTRQ